MGESRGRRGRRKHDSSADSGRHRSRKKRDSSDEGRRRKSRKDKESGAKSRGLGRQILSELWTFADSQRLVSVALGGIELDIPDSVLHRCRLRSDAVRLEEEGMCNRNLKKMSKAEELLTQAIAFEVEGVATLPPPPFAKKPLRPLQAAISRSCELHVLRGELRGSQELAKYEEALADFDFALFESPCYAHALMGKAKTMRRLGRLADALNCLERALQIRGTHVSEHDGVGLTTYVRRWAERCVEEIKDDLSKSGGPCNGDAVKDIGVPDAL